MREFGKIGKARFAILKGKIIISYIFKRKLKRALLVTMFSVFFFFFPQFVNSPSPEKSLISEKSPSPQICSLFKNFLVLKNFSFVKNLTVHKILFFSKINARPSNIHLDIVDHTHIVKVLLQFLISMSRLRL